MPISRNSEQTTKATDFRDLHLKEGIFVMPNAWNAGSACLLESAGFSAIATTSAGIAYSLGLPDYEGELTRDQALDESRRIAASVNIPVSVDAENGYGHEPAEVAQTITQVAELGAVGANIEDYAASYGGKMYERYLAVERIQAAAESAKKLNFPFTLTARAECYLVDHPNPFAESILRANLYREAGANCLFVPGVKGPDVIKQLVKEINGPISVVMGLSGNPISVSELEDLGVKRISIGGSLARATFGLIRRAAKEILENGTFDFSNQQIPDAELCRFFGKRLAGASSKME